MMNIIERLEDDEMYVDTIDDAIQVIKDLRVQRDWLLAGMEHIYTNESLEKVKSISGFVLSIFQDGRFDD